MASTSRGGGGGGGGGHQDPTRREATFQLQQLMNYEDQDDDEEESPFVVRVRVEPRRHSDFFAMSDVVVHFTFSPQIADGDMPLTEMNAALNEAMTKAIHKLQLMYPRRENWERLSTLETLGTNRTKCWRYGMPSIASISSALTATNSLESRGCLNVILVGCSVNQAAGRTNFLKATPKN